MKLLLEQTLEEWYKSLFEARAKDWPKFEAIAGDQETALRIENIYKEVSRKYGSKLRDPGEEHTNLAHEFAQRIKAENLPLRAAKFYFKKIGPIFCDEYDPRTGTCIHTRHGRFSTSLSKLPPNQRKVIRKTISHTFPGMTDTSLFQAFDEHR
jgi:hypothetical protein